MISLPVCTLICVRVSGRANWVPACVRTRVSENLSPRQSVLIVSSRSEFVSVVIWLCQRKERPFVVPHTTASNIIESNFNYLILLNRWTFIKDNFCEISLPQSTKVCTKIIHIPESAQIAQMKFCCLKNWSSKTTKANIIGVFCVRENIARAQN